MTESDSRRRFTVRVDGEVWEQAGSLDGAAPDERVFVLDASTGRVVFGDGTQGRRPPDGVVVEVSYREGEGTAGNTCVSVTTRWPPPGSRYLVALSSGGVRIGATGTGVERLGGAKRLTYFTGQVLGEADFRAEQQYLIERRHLHNRTLHGFGVANGLTVTVAGDGASPSVVVGPGVALDRLGREIELDDPTVLPIGSPGCPQYVIVEYIERETDPAPSLANGGGTAASRIEEGASIRLSSEAATADGIILARLLSDSTGWNVDDAFEPPRCR